MSIYRNQAQRVIDHISEQVKMKPEDVEKILKINVDMMENRIELMHIQTGMNGKKCADALIQAWEASHPDYITRQYNITYKVDGLVFHIKQIPKELFILFKGSHGDYLHSYKHEGELTEDVKLSACTDCLKAYNEKTKDL